MNNFHQKNLTATDTAEFAGVIIAKVAGGEFMVKLTKFPNKMKIPEDQDMTIKAKLCGRLITKAKVAMYDNVTIAISYENAKAKTGTIVKRERRQPVIAVKK